jgi:V-type H+-transporting ATPase subunit E
VKQETSAIDAQFEKRRKAGEIALKTSVPLGHFRYNDCYERLHFRAQSTANNKARLKLLQAREQHLQELFEKAREQIVHFSDSQGRYEQLLQSVIVQVYILVEMFEMCLMEGNRVYYR